MSSINDLKLALEKEQRKLSRQESAVQATKALITTLEHFIAQGNEKSRPTK